MNKSEIQEARKILGKEFDLVSDETIEMMLYTFKLIARKIIEELENAEVLDNKNILYKETE